MEGSGIEVKWQNKVEKRDFPAVHLQNKGSIDVRTVKGEKINKKNLKLYLKIIKHDIQHQIFYKTLPRKVK